MTTTYCPEDADPCPSNEGYGCTGHETMRAYSDEVRERIRDRVALDLDAQLTEALEEVQRLRDGIAAHRNYSEHYRSILWDGEAVWDLPHNEALWALLDEAT